MKERTILQTVVKVSRIRSNPKNPRIIKDEKFKDLCQSLKNFPKMMELRPIIIDNKQIILGGNMRFAALKEIGYTELPGEWVKKASNLTEEQKREFIIKDNVGYGEWNWEQLANEWDQELLNEWGLDVPVFANAEDPEDFSDKIKSQFKIEVICQSERDQEKTYNKLIEEGYECRILSF